MSRGGRGNLAEMTFFDHLDELRVALLRALGGFALAVIAGYFLSHYLQSLLILPFESLEDASLAILAPAEGFIVQLKISLVAGLFLAAPWIFYQLWRFVAPGLFAHERRMVFPVVFFSSALFLIGAAFATLVLPWATSFFLSFAREGIVNVWSLGRYVDFVLRMLLAFGIVFELPLLIYFLARFGVVTPSFLRTYRRHMYVVFLVGAAIITPPDVITQVVLAVPLVLLYEGSIFLAVVAKRKWDSRDEEGDEEKKNGSSSKSSAKGQASSDQEVPDKSKEG